MEDDFDLGTKSSRNVSRAGSASWFQQYGVPGIAVVACILALAALLKGPGIGGENGVAVIDLDRVASEVGKEDQIRKALGVEQETIQAEINDYASKLQQQLDANRNSLGPILDSAAQQNLNAVAQQLAKKLEASRSNASSVLSQKRYELVMAFREEVRPFAEEVARERGVGLIITNNEAVIYNAGPRVDITDAVIKNINKSTGYVLPVAEPEAESVSSDSLETTETDPTLQTEN